MYMQVVYQSCCGLDIHKKILVDWVKSKECSHVAMESTGVYWKPIYNLLELNEVETLVVNAQHIKAVLGRKTDVKDAERIADLLRHGLLKGSYIPDRDQRELRKLVRYRHSLIERTREVNRLQKVLEGANIKLDSVASNIMGVSGRVMIDAIIQDVNDPALLASLAKGKLKNKKEALEKALNGLIGSHQKMILATQLAHIDFLDQKIRDLDREVVDRTLPFEKDLELLDTIPGIGRRSAEEIIAEIGTDMNRFPSDAHLSSWAGMSLGQNEVQGNENPVKLEKEITHSEEL